VRGRKPKPAKLHELAGNPGHRPLNSSAPQPPVPDRAPYAPRHLNEAGKAEWNRVVKLLLDLELYTEMDQAALALYCQAWGRWVHAEKELEKKGEVLEGGQGGLYQNPWLHVANRSWEQLRKVLVEFGLSPSARERLHVEPDDEEPSLAEQLFEMVSGGDG